MKLVAHLPAETFFSNASTLNNLKRKVLSLFRSSVVLFCIVYVDPKSAHLEWYYNKAVLLLASNIDEWMLHSFTQDESFCYKSSSPRCPNIVKFYKKVRGVDLIDQKTAAYKLDRKSKFRFYLRMFFASLGVALINSIVVYQKLG